MKIKLIFAWYDFWIGFFFDKKKKFLYFFPIPMIGFVISFKRKCEHTWNLGEWNYQERYFKNTCTKCKKVRYFDI